MSCEWKNKPIWLANWRRHVTASKFQYTPGSLLLKQTRPTDLPLELAPSYQTSLIWRSKIREQKFCCATYFFARNRWCRRGRIAPGACCGSVLREQAASCVPALKVKMMLRFHSFENFLSLFISICLYVISSRVSDRIRNKSMVSISFTLILSVLQWQLYHIYKGT